MLWIDSVLTTIYVCEIKSVSIFASQQKDFQTREPSPTIAYRDMPFQSFIESSTGARRINHTLSKKRATSEECIICHQIRSKHPVCARTSITEHAQDSKHRMISSLHYENDPDIQIPKERDSNLSYLPLSPEPLPLPISPPLPTSCYVQEVYSLCIFDHSYIVSHFL